MREREKWYPAAYTTKCNCSTIHKISQSNFQKQVFEKWKEEHDSILKDRIKEKKQTERKKKLQQVREKEDRKKDCTSAFTEW